MSDNSKSLVFHFASDVLSWDVLWMRVSIFMLKLLVISNNKVVIHVISNLACSENLYDLTKQNYDSCPFLVQEDLEHLGDLGSLDDNVESFLSHDIGDAVNLYGTVKQRPAEQQNDSSKGQPKSYSFSISFVNQKGFLFSCLVTVISCSIQVLLLVKSVV